MEDQMNRATSTIIFILLGLNLLGTSYLVISRYSPSTKVAVQRKITEAELVQIDKIMNLAVEFRSELESIADKASYPSEKAKIAAGEYLQDHRMTFEKARIEHKKLHEEKTQEAAIRFLFTCWGQADLFSGPRLMDVNKYRFAKWNSNSDEYIPYPNVSFTKLESINNEFRILNI
jgi:hypothetical protein